jgi:prophage tail gpP-like protein
MRALCLITIKPGTVDKVTQLLSKKRKITKEVLAVTGRADICVLINGAINDINTTVMDFKKINDIVATETLMEMEVDLGW